MTTKEDIIEVLKKIEDPELHVDIWTLGLIYEIKMEKGVYIKMTFTSPMCPYAPHLVEKIKEGVLKLTKKEPQLEFTFDPPWDPSEEVKMMLGIA